MKIIKIDGDEGVVQSGGLKRKANFMFLKGPHVGDYVLLHAGFAIEKLKPEAAKQTLRLLKNL